MKADIALWCLWQVALQSVLVYGAAAVDRKVLNQAIYRKLRLVWISVIPLVTPPAPPEGFSIISVSPLVIPPAPPEGFSIILVLYKLLLLCSGCRQILKPVCTIWSFLVFASLFLYETGLYCNWWKPNWVWNTFKFKDHGTHCKFCINISFLGCRTHFGHIAVSPYTKWLNID